MVSFPSFVRAFLVLFSFICVLLQSSQLLSFCIALDCSLSGCGSLSFCLTAVLSLSLHLCLGAPALFLLAVPFGFVTLAVLLSPASPSPSLLSSAFRYLLPLLLLPGTPSSCLPAFSLVRGAVLFATFLLLLLYFTCAFYEGVVIFFGFPH